MFNTFTYDTHIHAHVSTCVYMYLIRLQYYNLYTDTVILTKTGTEGLEAREGGGRGKLRTS